jgi:CO/xanthine dehydrogenase Mo-binding subunit
MTKAEHIRNETTYVWTNTARGSFLRSGSFPTASDVLADSIFRIADQLNMDPTDVLLKNVHTPEPSVKQCLETGKQAIGWQWHKAGAKKLPNGKMHGVGFRMRDSHSWGSNVAIALKLKSDNKVYMPFGSAFFGVHGQDACAMVVAEELGARLEDVVVQYDPHSSMTFIVGGSDISSTAYAAQQAAIDLKAKIVAAGAAALNVKPEQVDTKDSTVYVLADASKSVPFGSLVSDAVGSLGSLNSLWQGTPPTNYDWSTKTYGPVNIVFGQVEVDPDTGEVDVTNMVFAYDGGKILRPSSFEGQLEGGMIWTISKAKGEEYIFDKATGVLLNGSALDYMPATILDVPDMQPITLETRTGGGVYQSSGVGENVWDQSVIGCAVFNAIGKWIEYPITPAKVLAALGNAEV